MTLEEVRARLDEIDERFRAIHEEAGDEPLTDEAQAEWDELTTEESELEARAEGIEKRLERIARDVANGHSERGADFGVPRVHTSSTSDDPYNLDEVRVSVDDYHAGRELRGRAMKAIERDFHLNDENKHRVTRMAERLGTPFHKHVLSTGSPAYRTAWAKAITGNADLLDDDERRAMKSVRALSLTDNAGGYAVPFTLDSTVIITGSGIVNPVRQVARVEQIVTDSWNGVTAGQIAASWDGEASQVGDDAPTIGQPSIDAEKAQAWIPASIEITQDWQGIAMELAMLFADAKDTLEGAAFTTGAGSGSDQPTGFTTATTVTSTTISAFGLVDVYKTLENLPARHRGNATWMANLNAINDVRQFGTANNYHGFLTDLSGDTPRQLLGKPLYENSSMASVVTTSALYLAIGDFRKYLIADRVGGTIEFVPHVFGANQRPTGQRGWYYYWRTGGGLLDADAFRILTLTS